MTTILALETATGPCSVAVWKQGRIAAYVEQLRPVMQSASLMPMVEEVLEKSATAYDDLTAVACTIGPGSFTGIRVALAAARGICFAAKVKGLGFTTLAVLASAAGGEKKILAALNAGKGEYYYQLFKNSPLGEPTVGPLDAALALAPDALLIGNAPAASGHPFPRADALAALAATEKNALPLRPFYIRPPDAKPQAKKA
jgi:tRNA threonylcarbamoyl adenosine modification protein YeaZ